MKSVYIVIASDCAQDGFEIINVFSSNEKALVCAKELEKRRGYYDYVDILLFDII